LIPYSTQAITLLDKLRVFNALGSLFITQGPRVTKFEIDVCRIVGAEFGIAVNSATSALHLACLALDLGPGDILWTTSISFVASANCGIYAGASVDFVDIDDRTWNISPEKLREKLITAKQEGKLPKIVVVVHLAGEPADLEEIHRLSLEFGFRVIEDASHALGSRYRGEYLGNSRFSDVTVFSFHAVKNISTGEGGMAMTNNPDVAQKLRMLRSHGITRDPKTFLMRNSIPAAWKYEQQMLGYNYRMTDFQAALGMSQLRKLTKFTQRRAAIASLYRQHLRGLENLRFQDLLEDSFSATHLVILRSSPELRSRIHGRLQSQNVGTNLHYYPIHLQPYHYSDARRPLVEAELYGNDAITIPCHPKLSNRQVKRIAGLIRDEASLVPRSNI